MSEINNKLSRPKHKICQVDGCYTYASYGLPGDKKTRC